MKERKRGEQIAGKHGARNARWVEVTALREGGGAGRYSPCDARCAPQTPGSFWREVYRERRSDETRCPARAKLADTELHSVPPLAEPGVLLPDTLRERKWNESDSFPKNRIGTNNRKWQPALPEYERGGGQGRNQTELPKLPVKEEAGKCGCWR